MILTFNFWGQCVFAVLVIGIGFTYLGWRTWQLYLVAPSHPVPYIFLGLEIMMYISSALWFVDMCWTKSRIRRPAILPVESFKDWPTVDLMICVCKEPTDLVKETILAALWQDYPAEKFTVVVCDDGGDEELRNWIENEQAVNGTNVRYIRRVKTPGVPHHAKAGNVNHAVSLTTGEFVGILDADMLVRPEYLRRMLAHFDSPRVAFVQCPQSYYNVPDGDPLGQVCTFFYHVIMPHRDTRNSAPSVGTGVIFRRKALEEVGGVSTGTLTEDFDTSLRLHGKGWHTAYITDKLQYGLVPTDLKSALRQRERWAIGTLEIMAKRNPMFAPGLSWHQRIMYFSCGVSYLIPVGIVVFIVLPLLTLFWDWPIMPTTAGNTSTLIFLLVPYLFATRLVIYVMYWGIEDAMTARNRDFQLFLWMSPYLCLALWKFIMTVVKPMSFKVTNAAKKQKKGSWFELGETASDLVTCSFHVAYLGLGIAASFTAYASQVLYVLLNMQSVMAPVVYVLSGDRGPEDRKERLDYNKYGVPVIDVAKVAPRPGRWVWMLELVPLVWGLFYVAIFAGFATGYTFGCSVYFAGSVPEISSSDWANKTRLGGGL
ncbi:nucleotide-diphospho-sugar transferase [Catenaria anguillulae PL171]|uniref:Nucleotide-diphospho-sugar transferase n=1 Tax=Catenaria anguillulae PL171 TaxID=765915 RepID=A0A1Y2I1K5_9FUNG|nr:nucleotide-diphospho-sugar transferase [Catenaria anguillulae PL171]